LKNARAIGSASDSSSFNCVSRLEWYHDSQEREREKQAKGEGTTKEPKARRSSAKQISTRKKISKTIQRRKDVDDEDDGAERGANIYHSRMLSHVLFMAAFRASGLITKDVEVKEQQLFV
jgi:hypothetical protein